MQPGPAGEIAPGIENEHAGPRLLHENGAQGFHNLDGLAGLGHEHPGGRADRDHGVPHVFTRFCGEGNRTIPAVLFQTGVVIFPVVNAVADQGTAVHIPKVRGAGLPALGEYPLLAAIGVSDLQLQLQDRGAVPAVSNNDTDCVASRLQVAGDVVGDVKDALGIVGPAGIKDVVADFFPVDA